MFSRTDKSCVILHIIYHYYHIKTVGKKISRGRNYRSGRATDEIDFIRKSSREDPVRKTKAPKTSGAVSEYAEDEKLSSAVTDKDDERDWCFFVKIPCYIRKKVHLLDTVLILF